MNDVDARARKDEPGTDADHLDRILGALTQLRLEHGDHACYDTIEEAVVARTQTIQRLRGALKAVAVVAGDGLSAC